MNRKMNEKETTVLLKNGLIIDGTNQRKAFKGSVLLDGDRIVSILEGDNNHEIKADKVIDCSGKVIAPGIIDVHSHHDYFMTTPTPEDCFKPFVMQGVTTYVGGNCGYSIAGHKKDTKFKDILENNLFANGHQGIFWDSVDSYYKYLETKSIPSNLAMYAGHGTIRESIVGAQTEPLNAEQMKELLYLLEKAMDEGAVGVSLGLMYAPGIYTPKEELIEVAKLVGRKNKILSLHPKVMTAISACYNVSPLEKPHNIIHLEEMIEIFKEAKCKVQWSHLLFCGRSSFGSVDDYLRIQDQAIADGVDMCFDIYAYTFGTSIITVSFPQWFMEQWPHSIDNPEMRDNFKLYIEEFLKIGGFTYNDVQIRSAEVEGMEKYNGWFLPDIAKDLNMSNADTMLELARGPAKVLQYGFNNQEIIDRLSQHPRSMYMTDSWIEPTELQNSASYGNFPRFIERARDCDLLPMEEVIYKMSGFVADRMNLPQRGNIKEGYYADIVVLDWDNVKDNVTPSNLNATPDGIVHVLINGQITVFDGEYQGDLDNGQTIKSM